MYEELRQEVIKKYGSIYKFCKENQDLKKSIVYLVLNGKYPGNILKQAAIIKARIQNKPYIFTINENELYKIMLDFRCGNCKLINKKCYECKENIEKEAKNIFSYLKNV